MAIEDAKPADSGSENRQAKEEALAGDFVPRPQFPAIARSVSREVAGLVQGDSEALGSRDSRRVLAAHMLEQDSRINSLSRDLGDAVERERQLRDEIGTLRDQHSAARQALADERKLRTPRALIIFVGSLLVPVGVEQLVASRPSLGVALMVAGLVIAGAGAWIGSSRTP